MSVVGTKSAYIYKKDVSKEEWDKIIRDYHIPADSEKVFVVINVVPDPTDDDESNHIDKH